MELETIITLIVLGVVVLGGLASIIIAIVRGDMKKFIEEKMCEAEKMKLEGKEKLAYVLNAVKVKYKIAELIINVRKFIEHIIDLSKQINSK